MTSIRVPDTISKLNPSDTYPIVEGQDVSGFSDLRNELNDNTTKIEANILNIKNLTKAGKTAVFSNVGDTSPVYDSEPLGNYLIVQRAQTSRITINTPDPTGGMLDGAIFTIYNENPTQAVNLVPGDPADSVNNATATNIPPENFASFVYQLKDRNFMELESGYIPAARVNIANYVEQKITMDGKIATLADLERLNADVTALINAGVQSVPDALRDDVPAAYDTLNKLYVFASSLNDRITALDVRVDSLETSMADVLTNVGTLQTDVTGLIASKASFAQVSLTFTDANSDGIMEADVTNPLGHTRLLIMVQDEVTSGNFRLLSNDTYEVTVTTSQLKFRSLSPSVLGKTFTAYVVGI